jgi:hypothetical protein
MPEDPVHINGQDPALEKLGQQLMHVHAPLTVYFGSGRVAIGEAVVSGGNIEAHIDGETSPDVAEILYRMIVAGVILDVSVTFNAPPATPVCGTDGSVKWMKNF